MAGAAGALRGRVVPALVVERVGDGRRAKQADDLLLAHAGLQLVDRRFLEQVALVDRLPVDDAATGNHEGDEGEDQEFAHGEPQAGDCADDTLTRSEEHTSELQSLMRISYAVFCLKKQNNRSNKTAYHKT